MEMCMLKYSSTKNATTQGAMLSIVCLICFADPEQFLKMLHLKNKVNDLLDLIGKEFGNMKWPQQRCVIVGLSSVLTLEPLQLPPSLHPNRLVQLAVDLVTYLLEFNFEEEGAVEDDDEEDDDDMVDGDEVEVENVDDDDDDDDDEDDDDDDDNDNDNDNKDDNKDNASQNSGVSNDETKKNKMETGEDDDERSVHHFTERNETLNLAANADYVNQEDADYAKKMKDFV
ncbi:hypothetical protein RFI_21147 [Reticulomyxa filosa]|uniref:Uncharacterized protein n=1 Tax=Reticulomyxa filosa TaxID=46433 RepID=X6MRB9_RETFI|nr:hypothetical protein RFI_21147 [Reticulomyxa filosa]|eukprot:ETO16211.1 hypothetical protein RFI_21147 [Reticulomyxa filosa]